jgi:tetratricopeptide (TPR) repeat protein
MVVFQAIAIGLWLLLASAAGSEETSQVFERAEKFAWRQNWAKARPLYAQAADEFEANGKERPAIAARLGLILSRMFTLSSKLLLVELEEESRRPLVAQDADLQLRYLAAKAYLEEQPNLLASRQAWNQVLEIARHLGDQEWESRASGHLGILLWVIDIDSAGATRRVGQALVDAIKTSDLSAQVWFQEEVGEVMCLMKRYEAAMNFYQKALVSASLDKDCPFPLDVYLGKARGLIQMGKPREALPLIERAEREATAVGDENAFAEGLILQARIVSTEDTAQASSLLNSAISLSEKNEFRRTLADALEEMAALQRLQGNDEKSKLYQTQCIEVTKSRHDGYSLPERYSRLAEIQVRQGNTAEASALYEQITDITEGLLINSPSPYAKASLINWLSDIGASVINCC